MKVLLINKNRPNFRTFAEQYRLFNNWEDAIDAATELGWKPMFGGPSREVGMMHQFACGDVNINMMAIEEE